MSATSDISTAAGLLRMLSSCSPAAMGPALSGPLCRQRQKQGFWYHRACLASHELSLFGQWFSRLQTKQMGPLREGVAPHLHDDLQRQLISAARPAPTASTGHQKTSQHPAHEPITQLYPNSPLPALLLRKFGIDHALLIVRTSAAACIHILAAYANLDGADCRLIYSTDGTAYPKLMLTQRATGLGLTADPLAELLSFIDGLRAVRRCFKPAGSRKAANRRYLEVGVPTSQEDSAPGPGGGRRETGDRAVRLEKL
eukprot:jgi/Tetstr1/440893/TSEL_029165.t1